MYSLKHQFKLLSLIDCFKNVEFFQYKIMIKQCDIFLLFFEKNQELIFPSEELRKLWRWTGSNFLSALSLFDR